MKMDLKKLFIRQHNMAMGEGAWQLVARGETVTLEAIASRVVALSERRDDLAASIAPSVLLQE